MPSGSATWSGCALAAAAASSERSQTCWTARPTTCSSCTCSTGASISCRSRARPYPRSTCRDACWSWRRRSPNRSASRRGSVLEIDVFTLFPHWFAWLSEETAVQRALSGPLSLRFLSYRDYSPLPHAQVDDAPFGGGAGMLMRVDAVASAVEGAYAGDLASVRAARRIVALDPGGRRFDDGYARELAACERIT